MTSLQTELVTHCERIHRLNEEPSTFFGRLVRSVINVFYPTSVRKDKAILQLNHFLSFNFQYDQLNFNARIDNGPTALGIIAETFGSRSHLYSRTLSNLLRHVDLSRLNFNAPNKEGKTPLWRIIPDLFNIDYRIDYTKLDYNAKVTAGPDKGKTPLWLIAQHARYVSKENLIRFFKSIPILSLNLKAGPQDKENRYKNVMWLLMKAAAHGKKFPFLSIFNIRKDALSNFNIDVNNHPDKITKLIEIIIEKSSFESPEVLTEILAYFRFPTEYLNTKIKSGRNCGKTLLWLAAKYALAGHPKALTFIIEKYNLNKLDFNARAENDDQEKGKTPLWFISKLALKQANALRAIFLEADLLNLDFNAKAENLSNNGETPLLHIAKLAKKDRWFLKKIIEQGNLARLDFNAKYENNFYEGGRTAFWCITDAIDQIGLNNFKKILEINSSNPLDFNAEITNGPDNGSTPLLNLAIADSQEALTLVLKEIELTQLNFNSTLKKGQLKGTSPLWWITKHAATTYETKDLLFILANVEIPTLNFNATCNTSKNYIHKNVNVLWWAAQIAKNQYSILRIILNNANQPFDFTAKPHNGKSVTQLIVDAVISENLYQLVDLVAKAGMNETLLRKATKKACRQNHLPTAQAFLAHIQLYQIPLQDIFNLKEIFNTCQKIKAFLKRPVKFIEDNNICSSAQISALKLLEVENTIHRLEQEKAKDFENAMIDKDIIHAKRHFELNIVPHFKSRFLSYSPTQNKAECILFIEKEIRQLILENILEDAKEQNQQSIQDFIHNNFALLVEGHDDAFKASCLVFTSTHVAHSAWRGYNPYAPVKNELHFPNLLTPPSSNALIFSTAASHQEDLFSQTGSDIVREQVAYYYLAVIDKNDGDEPIRQNRIANFIGQLADIRNTHGIDDPACYPGHLSRIAKMGSFHSIAQLPNTLEIMLEDYFKAKVLNIFQKMIKELDDPSENSKLFHAIIDLRQDTARDIVKNPKQFSSLLLLLRAGFTTIMGTLPENCDAINAILKRQKLLALDGSDMFYVKQYLHDIARGKIYYALETLYHQLTDSVPTVEDILKANPFHPEEENKAHQLFKTILHSLLGQLPQYQKSNHKLNGLADCLKGKVCAIIAQPATLKEQLQKVFASIDFMESQNEVSIFEITMEELQKAGFIQPIDLIIESSFGKDLNVLEAQLTSNQFTPMMKLQLERKLNSLREKQDCFQHFLPIIKEIFSGLEMNGEFLKTFTEAVVFHVVSQDQKILNVEKFLSEDMFSFKSEEKEFILANLTLLNKLAEEINLNAKNGDERIRLSIF